MKTLSTSATLLALTALAQAAPRAGELQVEWHAPEVFVEGLAYRVRVEVKAPADEVSLPVWMLTPAAFSIDGLPLAERTKGEGVALVPDALLVLEYDLSDYLQVQGNFKLSFGSNGSGEAVDVTAYRSAPEGIDFLEMVSEELGQYRVVLDTNQGTMLAEFWPEVAPNHVRNFLELSYSRFYDGILFHRVIPGFMIQCGDPNTKNPDSDPRNWGSGSGPRTLEAEFNDRKHVRGVLSMARTADPHSATSQFFVCHDTAPHLDNQYTGFGKLLSGFEALDKIANAKKGARDQPAEPQRILRAAVVLPFQE